MIYIWYLLLPLLPILLYCNNVYETLTVFSFRRKHVLLVNMLPSQNKHTMIVCLFFVQQRTDCSNLNSKN